MASKDKRVRIVLTLENCLIPAERLENTPSRIDGLSTEDEMDIRIVACEMIQNAGVLLRLPQVITLISYQKVQGSASELFMS